MKPVIIPIVWLNESVVLDDETRNYLYNNVVTQQEAVYAGSYSALGIGALLALAGIIAIVFIVVRVSRLCKRQSYTRAFVETRAFSETTEFGSG